MSNVWDWMTTVDHKKIGVRYLFAVLFMFFLGGVAALAVRLELLEPVRIAADGSLQGSQVMVSDLFGTDWQAGDPVITFNPVTSQYLVVFHGRALVGAVLCFNLLGDGLRDVLDPRLDRDR